ncbi:MAG TPA: hypothetical protein PLU58_09175 [Saprospiraceae bacterium]|jgi:hypothetical protein|nr:hypothetical protein [Saprospiraceae bacterium]
MRSFSNILFLVLFMNCVVQAQYSHSIRAGIGLEYLKFHHNAPHYKQYNYFLNSHLYKRLNLNYNAYLFHDHLLLGIGYNLGGYQYNVTEVSTGRKYNQSLTMHSIMLRTLYSKRIWQDIIGVKKRKKTKNKEDIELLCQVGTAQGFIVKSSWETFDTSRVNGKEVIDPFLIYLSFGFELKKTFAKKKAWSADIKFNFGLNDIDKVSYSRSRLNNVEIAISKYF